MFFAIHLIIFAVFGLVVGVVAKALHPGEDPIGFLPTVGIGIAGSYIGGLLNYLIGWNTEIVSPSGWIMSIIGGVLFCYVYSALKRAEK